MAIPKLLDYRKYMATSTESRPTTWGDMYRFFENRGEITKSLVGCLLWQPQTEYKTGASVHAPSIPVGCVARCVTGGVTGDNEPMWDLADGDVTDGTCVWEIENTVRKTLMEEVEASITKQVESLHETITKQVDERLLNAFPVGTILETTNSANPSTYIGGTWEQLGAGLTTITAGTYKETHNGTAVTSPETA